MSEQPLHHVWTYTQRDQEFWTQNLAEWLPVKVIDGHTHICEPRFRKIEMTEEKRRQYWVNEVVEPISAADAERCYKTVFPDKEFSCLAMGHPSLEFDVEGSNEQLADDCAKRGWKSLAVVRPQWTQEELVCHLDRPSVIGAKPYYDLISYDPTSRDKHIEASIFEFLPHHQLEVLDQRRAWVTLHVSRADRLGHPANIAEVREIRQKYPNIILVIAHFGRCYTLPHAQEALPQLADDEGLLFDNSAVFNPEVHRFAMELLGPDRIIYGTDNPIFYMRGRRQWEGLKYINRTSYPFHFNVDRESPEIEAAYTLYMYEAIDAIRKAAQDLSFSREDIDKIFFANAEKYMQQANVAE